MFWVSKGNIQKSKTHEIHVLRAQKKSCDLQQEHHHIRVIESDTKWHGPEKKEAPPFWLWKPKAVFLTSRPLENAMTSFLCHSWKTHTTIQTRHYQRAKSLKTAVHLHCLIPSYPSSHNYGSVENDPSFYRERSFSGGGHFQPLLTWIWKKFPKSYPKWWWKMVMVPIIESVKKSLNKSKTPLFPNKWKMETQVIRG